MFKGVPWLCQRGRDLLPHAAGLVLRELLSRRRLPARPPVNSPPAALYSARAVR